MWNKKYRADIKDNGSMTLQLKVYFSSVFCKNSDVEPAKERQDD